jgi:late competence protein required for DNA uptake (superfamily II DNA/RNA helicase)
MLLKPITIVLTSKNIVNPHIFRISAAGETEMQFAVEGIELVLERHGEIIVAELRIDQIRLLLSRLSEISK